MSGVPLFVIALLVFVAATCTPKGDHSGSKVLPPLDVQLHIGEQRLAIGTRTSFQVSFIPLADFYRAEGRLNSTGVVSVVKTPNLEWTAPRNGDTLTGSGAFRIDEYGEGHLQVSVTVYDQSDSTLFGRSFITYFFATAESIFTNNSSPMLLKRDYLKYLLESKKISRQEYDKNLEQLLGGGAKEDSGATKGSR